MRVKNETVAFMSVQGQLVLVDPPDGDYIKWSPMKLSFGMSEKDHVLSSVAKDPQKNEKNEFFSWKQTDLGSNLGSCTVIWGQISLPLCASSVN